MKIAYFNANMKRGQDGVTRVLYAMIDGARERGHRIMAVTSTLPEPMEVNFPIIRVPSVALPLQKAYRIAFPCYHTFAGALRDFSPDIIHLNSPCPLGFAAEAYARDFNIPVVATYHTHFPEYTRYYKLDGLENLAWTITKLFYGNVDRIFVPAPTILEELARHDLHGLHYLPNGIDLGLFSPTHRSDEWRRSISGDSRLPVILFVSRLVWEKDLSDLARAYDLLKNRRSDFTMAVVGEGPARQEFERMMPGVKFLGYKSGEELARCYASSDIFVFPSTTETFGLVTLEAMASGIVPVAVNKGGAVGIIEDGISGLLVPPHNAEMIALKVEELIDSPEMRAALSRQAIKRAEEFSWHNVLHRLFENYDEVRKMHKFLKNRYAA